MDMIDRILKLVDESSLNDSKIVKDLQLSNGVIGQWRKRKQKPSTDAVIKLAKYFNVSTDYILTGKNEKTGLVNASNHTTSIIDEFTEMIISVTSMLQKVDSNSKHHIIQSIMTICNETEKNNSDKLIKHNQLHDPEISVLQDTEDGPTIEIRCSSYKVSAGTGNMLGDYDSWEHIDIPDTPTNRKADFALVITGESMKPMFNDGDIVLVKEQASINIGEIGIFIINNEEFIKKLATDRLISLNDNYDDIYVNENDDIRCCGKVIGRI